MNMLRLALECLNLLLIVNAAPTSDDEERRLLSTLVETAAPLLHSIVAVGSDQCEYVKEFLGLTYEQFQANNISDPGRSLSIDLITPSGPQKLNIISAKSTIPRSRDYNPNNQLVIVIHGFMESSESEMVKEISQGFLDRTGYNIMALDGGQLINMMYFRSTTYVRFMGEKLGQLLAGLVNDNYANPKSISIVGHSLGAHIAGISGKEFQRITGSRIARITGLDPAGPCFSNVEEEARLHKGDAEYVDVIHTDGGLLGLKEPLGGLMELIVRLNRYKKHVVHIARISGKEFQRITGSRIARITGLDPAGPCFSNVEEEARLHKGDAEYVDVIHTDGGLLGLKEPLGGLMELIVRLNRYKKHVVHIARISGKKFQRITGSRIARITGLDPAGPCFSNVEEEARLHKGDAEYVDVIHTDGGLLGLKEPLGGLMELIVRLNRYKKHVVHIARISGKKFQRITGSRIARITGLDPAGPCFSNVEEEARLHKGDAEYVDVIHTDGGLLGLKEPLGGLMELIVRLNRYKKHVVHIARISGKKFQRITGSRIARITGLDPTGPCFSNVEEEARLHKGDAEYVDVIHTDGGLLGLKEPLGGLMELIVRLNRYKKHVVHIARISGKKFQRITGSRIARITGLDPAGHCFSNVEEEARLHKGDAEYVDVIHTDGGLLGLKEPLGGLMELIVRLNRLKKDVAHIARISGKEFQRITESRIARSTGLDPAGPCFSNVEEEARLHKGDAEYVDVIHTDGGLLGLKEPLGGLMELIVRLNRLKKDVAHIAGISGKEFQRITESRIARSTGLDPAGPCFSNVEEEARLHKGDAEYVDVIHTDGGLLGLKEPLGDQDYFPNGGSVQPGCLLPPCCHTRAWQLYAESVRNPQAFPARRCMGWESFRADTCEDGTTSYMGLGSRPVASGSYYLYTGNSAPYDLG